jgi:hypothetical protein
VLALHEIDYLELAIDAVLGDEEPDWPAGRGYRVVIELHESMPPFADELDRCRNVQ